MKPVLMAELMEIVHMEAAYLEEEDMSTETEIKYHNG